MFLDDLNYLPEWDEKHFRFERGEEWKHRTALNLARDLYNQWREVFGLVIAFTETLPEEPDEKITTKSLIYESAMMVAPKIMSAAGDTLYMIKMENAALIRFHSQQMMEQVGFAVLAGKADERHKDVIDEALGKFKEIFRQWAATFQKDEYEDEWGLF